MKDFIKVLRDADGNQVAFLCAKEPDAAHWIFMGLTIGVEGQFVDTRISGTEEQMRNVFDLVSEDMVATMRKQAADTVPKPVDDGAANDAALH